jgi:hypothetical protein
MPYQQVQNRIIEFLAAGPQPLEAILNHLKEADVEAEAFKEAVWRLLDKNEVEITRDYKLKAVRLDFAGD